MASRGRRGRGRGSRRGILVREMAYAMPVQEPSNFIEEDFRILIDPSSAGSDDTDDITYNQILQAIGASGSVKRFRVTSIVVDPMINFSNQIADNSTSPVFTSQPRCELIAQMSGLHYEQADLNKPLRVKFSNTYGSPGQWIRVNGGSIVPEGALPGFPTDNPGDSPAFTVAASFSPRLGVGFETEVHIRVAWDDSDAQG